MGLFGGDSTSTYAPDNRQYFDSYNVASNPTLALSDLGKVTVNIQKEPPAGLKSGAPLDARWLATAGVLVAGALAAWLFTSD